VFPGGAPNDFAQTFGLDLVPEAAASVLTSPRVMRVDVGTASFGDGRETVVANEVVVGLGAVALRRARRLPGRPGRLAAWWSALLTYRRRQVDVDMQFADWHGPLVQLRAMNGQYALDRLHVAPMALPDDGAWDVQVWDGPRHLPFTLQPQMLRGEHLPHDHVSQWRQKRVEISGRHPLPVAVDDRYAGRTPVTLTLREKALRLKV
jgi:diacylglycerol kinase (ATP)